MTALHTYELEKEYLAGDERVHALRGVSFAVQPGEIYALLGPNGAGKTTLLSILTTLLPATRGTAQVAGYDVVAQAAEVRRRIGVTFQDIVVDGELTGQQTLDFHGQLYGQDAPTRRRRIDELAALVELTGVLNRKAHTYSGGMKRRLELARGLMTAPEILFLDEPTQGLDPQNRAGIWRYIRRLRAERGMTLLLTTHYMDEAEQLADRVGIIDRGLLVAEGTPGELVQRMGSDVITLEGPGSVDGLQARLEAEAYVSQVTLHTTEGVHRLQIGVDNGEQRLASVVGLAAAGGIHVQRVSTNRPSLGDVFLAVTGYALRDELSTA
jgi:ABC-2 type transport system ATP-binding protein